MMVQLITLALSCASPSQYTYVHVSKLRPALSIFPCHLLCSLLDIGMPHISKTGHPLVHIPRNTYQRAWINIKIHVKIHNSNAMVTYSLQRVCGGHTVTLIPQIIWWPHKIYASHVVISRLLARRKVIASLANFFNFT